MSNPFDIVKKATSYVQSNVNYAASKVSNAVSTVKKEVVSTAKAVYTNPTVKAAGDGFKIWGNGINDAVQKNFGVQGLTSNATGGTLYSVATKGAVTAAKGIGVTSLAKTGYDAVVNIATGYYNYFTGHK